MRRGATCVPCGLHEEVTHERLLALGHLCHVLGNSVHTHRVTCYQSLQSLVQFIGVLLLEAPHIVCDIGGVMPNYEQGCIDSHLQEYVRLWLWLWLCLWT